MGNQIVKSYESLSGGEIWALGVAITCFIVSIFTLIIMAKTAKGGQSALGPLKTLAFNVAYMTIIPGVVTGCIYLGAALNGVIKEAGKDLGAKIEQEDISLD
ncbi:hypothetical protein [Laceyella putida]|uniref:DUF3566 domain-containing protein n=1 Tax=Laceyella putida TaxID=110101 RepID=A0ABW2RQF4_9BACL